MAECHTPDKFGHFDECPNEKDEFKEQRFRYVQYVLNRRNHFGKLCEHYAFLPLRTETRLCTSARPGVPCWPPMLSTQLSCTRLSMTAEPVRGLLSGPLQPIPACTRIVTLSPVLIE